MIEADHHRSTSSIVARLNKNSIDKFIMLRMRAEPRCEIGFYELPRGAQRGCPSLNNAHRNHATCGS